MNRTLTAAAVVTGIAALAVGPLAPVQAATRTTVSGTYQFVDATIPVPRVASDHLVLDGLTATVVWTGTFEGTSHLTGRLVLRPIGNGDPFLGTANYQYTDVFVGTVNGVPGTMTLLEEGQTGKDGIVHSKNVVISASGGLAGLTGMVMGTGTVAGPNGPSGSYAGSLSMP